MVLRDKSVRSSDEQVKAATGLDEVQVTHEEIHAR